MNSWGRSWSRQKSRWLRIWTRWERKFASFIDAPQPCVLGLLACSQKLLAVHINEIIIYWTNTVSIYTFHNNNIMVVASHSHWVQGYIFLAWMRLWQIHLMKRTISLHAAAKASHPSGLWRQWLPPSDLYQTDAGQTNPLLGGHWEAQPLCKYMCMAGQLLL